MDALATAYAWEQDAQTRSSLAATLSRAGGRGGVEWVARQTENAYDDEEWSMLVSVLGDSGSHAASSYLNALLNRMAAQNPAETERKQLVREAILSLNATLER